MPSGQQVGYVRVSSTDQNPERQLDRLFTDTVSGKDVTRPQLQAMLAFVRDGDTLVVHTAHRRRCLGPPPPGM